MEIHVGLTLSQSEVKSLLNRFDDSSDPPLHLGLDFESYSKKLSDFAYFIIAEESKEQIGFIAYYLNDILSFVYIPQIVVHKTSRHQGVGHIMLNRLLDIIKGQYKSLQLEVLKDNLYALSFYRREGFKTIEVRDFKFLMALDL